MCFRGTPCLYQGEELGLEEAEIPFEQLVDPYGIAFFPDFKGRDGCRTPMPWVTSAPNAGFCSASAKPWLPIPESHRSQAVDRAIRDPESIFHLLRDLLAFRRTHPSLALGRMTVLESDPRVLRFLREHAGERTECAFNLSPDPIEVDPPADWVSLLGRQRGVSPLSEDGPLLMGPWSWYIRVFEKLNP